MARELTQWFKVCAVLEFGSCHLHQAALSSKGSHTLLWPRLTPTHIALFTWTSTKIYQIKNAAISYFLSCTGCKSWGLGKCNSV